MQPGVASTGGAGHIPVGGMGWNCAMLACDGGHEMTLPNPLITIDPERMSGAPCFTGTRVPIQNLFDYLEGGDPLDEFLDQFPGITRQHALAVLQMAQTALISEARASRMAAE
jgi:uncharacterized protein (DUF433 family)